MNKLFIFDKMVTPTPARCLAFAKSTGGIAESAMPPVNLATTRGVTGVKFHGNGII